MSGVFSDKNPPFQAYDPINSNVVDDLTALDTTDIVNLTEKGKLSEIVLSTGTAVTGSPTSTLEIIVDGGSTRTIKVHAANSRWDGSGAGAFTLGKQSAGGSANEDHAYIPINLEYAKSLVVRHNVSVVATAGTLRITVFRGIAL